MSRARSGTIHSTRSTGDGTNFESQIGSTPSPVRALSASPIRIHSPLPTMALQGVRPVFITRDVDKPTEAELWEHFTHARTYVNGIAMVLSYIGDDPTKRLEGLTIPEVKGMSIARMWRCAQNIGEEMGEWEKYLSDVKDKKNRDKIISLRRSVSVQPDNHKSSLKTPLPTKYDGKKGDNAATFIAACNNYRVMQPQAFYDEKVLVRWALQQMEDRAGPWAIRQMQRMDTELDEDGDPPEELRDWTRFCESFLTQFDDPGLVEKARVKWKDGINQRGKAVDYFEEIETLLIRLKYPRDQDMTLDQIIAGLKPHIRTHFIGSSWDTLNEMKSQIIPYDSAYWEINKATGAKTGSNKDSKATSSTQERGKSTTPQVKTEVAKAGATQ